MLKRSRSSDGLVSHIGFWHVRDSSALPSAADEQAMLELLGYTPGMLLLALRTLPADSITQHPASDICAKVLIT